MHLHLLPQLFFFHLPDSRSSYISPGAGYDQIDIPACTAAGIQVSHTPTAVDAATADTALFLLLGALRLFNSPLHALRAGSWRGGPPAPPLGHDPEGKVLGILGMGGIGRELKKKVEEALGMKVQYHNRRELDPKLAAGASYVSFKDLLATSDVISLNLPLNVSGPFLDPSFFFPPPPRLVLGKKAHFSHPPRLLSTLFPSSEVPQTSSFNLLDLLFRVDSSLLHN